MRTTPTTLHSFASVEEFLAQSGLLEKWDKEAIQCRLRAAMASVGFTLVRTEHIPQHRLTLLDASRPLAQEFRLTRNIRKSIVRTFQGQGFDVRTGLVAVYWGRNWVRIHVGVLQAA
jgi:hypothetical protein